MKRTSAILALLLVAIVASISLWQALDVSPPSPTATVRETGDGPVPAADVKPSKAALEADASERSVEAKPAPSQLGREAITAAPEPDDITVHGTLRDSVVNSRFIAGAKVKLVGKTQRLALETDLDGQFELHGFRPGAWNITIEANGYRKWSKDWTFPVEPAFQEFLVGLDRLNVVWVALRTPDGAGFFDAARDVFDLLRKDPLAQGRLGIVLVATGVAPGERLVFGRDDLRRTPLGEIALDAGPSGGMLVRADRFFEFPKPLPMFLSACCGEVVLDTQFVQAGQESVTMSISVDQLRRQLHTVKVRVLEADGDAPVAGALVSLAPELVTSRGGRAVDATGLAQFENQLPGPRNLSVQAPEHEWLQLAVRVEAAGDTDLGAIRLARSTSIEGQCVFEGSPPVNVMMFVSELDSEPRVAATSGIQMHGESPGSFVFKELGRHKYSIRVNDAHWSAKPVVVDTTNGSVSGVKVQCVPAVNVVLEVDPEMVDEILVTDPDRVPVARAFVPADGRVALSLFAGAFSATLRKLGQGVATTRLQAGGGDQVIDLRHP
jgi:hypothetical protein